MALKDIKTHEAPIMIGTSGDRALLTAATIPQGTLFFQTNNADLYILVVNAWVKVLIPVA